MYFTINEKVVLMRGQAHCEHRVLNLSHSPEENSPATCLCERVLEAGNEAVLYEELQNLLHHLDSDPELRIDNSFLGVFGVLVETLNGENDHIKRISLAIISTILTTGNITALEWFLVPDFIDLMLKHGPGSDSYVSNALMNIFTQAMLITGLEEVRNMIASVISIPILVGNYYSSSDKDHRGACFGMMAAICAIPIEGAEEVGKVAAERLETCDDPDDIVAVLRFMSNFLMWYDGPFILSDFGSLLSIDNDDIACEVLYLVSVMGTRYRQVPLNIGQLMSFITSNTRSEKVRGHAAHAFQCLISDEEVAAAMNSRDCPVIPRLMVAVGDVNTETKFHICSAILKCACAIENPESVMCYFPPGTEVTTFADISQDILEMDNFTLHTLFISAWDRIFTVSSGRLLGALKRDFLTNMGDRSGLFWESFSCDDDELEEKATAFYYHWFEIEEDQEM